MLKTLFAESGSWTYWTVFWIAFLVPMGFLIFIVFKKRLFSFYYLLTALIPITFGFIGSIDFYLDSEIKCQNTLYPLYFGLFGATPILATGLIYLIFTWNKK